MASPSATLLQDGRVLIAGGYHVDSKGDYQYHDEAYLFDPATNTFSSAGKMKDARSDHTATLLKDGRVLVVGGKGSDYFESAEIFDPSKLPGNAWSAAKPMNRHRYADSS